VSICINADRSHDDAGEPLCTATPLTNPTPANCPASALIDITRTQDPRRHLHEIAAREIGTEYTKNLPAHRP